MEKGRTRVIKKKGFSFLSFLLGILFGIILLLGAVGGAIAFVLFTDLDTVFGTLGMENKDEDGNYIYINTNPDDGGAKTVLDLVQVMQGYFVDFGNQSLGELEHTVPAVAGMVDEIFTAFSDYVEVDLDKLRATKFAEIGTFVSDTVMDIKPATLIKDFGVETEGDGVASTLMSAIVYGAEAGYVEVDGTKYPVRYEEVAAEPTVRTARDAQPDDEGNATVKIYFYENGGEYRLVNKNADGSYTATGDSYTPTAPKLTGHYYYANGDTTTDRIVETPITLRLITSDDGMQEILNGLLITDLINQDEGMIGDILGGLSVGQITSGEVDINEKVQSLEIATLIDIDPESTIMTYLGYGLSAVVKAEDGLSYQYTASLEGKTVYVCAEEGKITGVYEDEELHTAVTGTQVGNIGERIDGAKVDAFMDITPDNKLMVFIAYGVTGVTEADSAEYDYTGKYSYRAETENGTEEREVTCYIVVNGGKIGRVYYYEDGQDVTVEACKLSAVGDRVNDLKIDVILDIELDSPVLMYLGYGVTGVVPADGDDYNYVGNYHVGGNSVKCYISSQNNAVNEIYYKNDDQSKSYIRATGINNITDRVKGITDDLSIAEFMDIKYDNAIMMYIAYGVCELDGLTGVYTDNKKPVTIETDTEGNVKYVYYMENGERQYVTGTSINGIGDRVQSFKDDLTLGEILDVSADDTILYALKDSKIGAIGTDVKELELGVFLNSDGSENSSILDSLKTTKVKDISTKINSLTLQELYPINIYGTKEFALAQSYNPAYVYYTENNGEYTPVNGTGKLTGSEFTAGTYYTRGALTGVWMFLLADYNEEGGYYNEKLCNLNDIGGLIGGVATNINNAKMFDLLNAGVINTDRANLEKDLIWYEVTVVGGVPTNYEKHNEGQIGNMKLSRLIDVVLEIAASTSSGN